MEQAAPHHRSTSGFLSVTEGECCDGAIKRDAVSLREMVLRICGLADGAGLKDNNIGARFLETGDVTMRMALLVNFAVWGMIVCAAVQTARQFALF